MFLNEAFYRGGKQGKALQWLNLCRLYLQVTTLADIVTEDGRYITYAARHGQKDITCIKYNRWPNQGNPGVKIWDEWSKCLAEVFCGGRTDGTLLSPLGKWTNVLPTDWEWFYSIFEE